MTEHSKIEWTTHTFNPWTGCAKVSAGCAHCYAEHAAPTRIARARGLELWGRDAARKVASEAMWREPLKWDRKAEAAGERHRVFCASLADVFEDRVDLDEHRVRLFSLIRATPNLDWLLLTKRPERVKALLARALDLAPTAKAGVGAWLWSWLDCCPPSNVWLGTTVEDQAAADARIPHLLATPAAVRFLSCEPLLGSVQLGVGGALYDYGTARTVDWVIAGGESGPGARPCDIGDVRDIVTQCRAAGVPVFVKQLGAQPRASMLTDPVALLSITDRKGGDMSEFPGDLRVREFPAVTP